MSDPWIIPPRRGSSGKVRASIARVILALKNGEFVAQADIRTAVKALEEWQNEDRLYREEERALDQRLDRQPVAVPARTSEPSMAKDFPCPNCKTGTYCASDKFCHECGWKPTARTSEPDQVMALAKVLYAAYGPRLTTWEELTARSDAGFSSGLDRWLNVARAARTDVPSEPSLAAKIGACRAYWQFQGIDNAPCLELEAWEAVLRAAYEVDGLRAGDAPEKGP